MAKKIKNKKKHRKLKEKIKFRKNLSGYWNFLKKYKWLFFFTLFLVLILEAASVSDKFLFKIIIDNGTEFVAGTLLAGKFVSLLLAIAVIFLVLSVIKVIGRWVYLHTTNILEAKLILDLKEKFFNHIIGLSHGFHTSHKTGSLISRLTRGGRAMEGMTDLIIFEFAPLIFQLIIAGISLIYLDVLSAIAIFFTIVLFISYSFFIQNRAARSNLIANEAEDVEKANIGDIFTNIESIKYFGKESAIKNRFHKVASGTSKAFFRNWTYGNWASAGQSLILSVGTFFLIYFPLKSFLAGELSLGTLTFIYTVYASIIGPMFGFVHGLRNLYRVLADFDALFEYGEIKNDIEDLPDAKEMKIKSGEVEFRNVDFSYDRRKIFRNFNLKVPKNKKIALVGHSGCGKTTLIKLLYRFYDVSKGRILIDGEDIRDFKQESLRGEMSIVPQECVLFDDTIYNNVAFSDPSASRQEVMRAIKFAQLDKMIKNFPKKENTIVGERGVRLSGGEKQRVSIARAILANKKILVLDEATSSLDSQTEYEIQRDLGRLMEGRTSIIIAHRLSTIMHADKIVVLKQGKIVQQGKHNDLIHQDGEYKHLWELQKGGYIK